MKASSGSRTQQLRRLKLIRGLRETFPNRERQCKDDLRIARERLRGDGDSQGRPRDMADTAHRNTDQAIVAQAVSDGQQKLLEIAAARERLKSGVYGVCENCEAEISLRRLEANPFARFCIECQERDEASRERTPRRLLPAPAI